MTKILIAEDHSVTQRVLSHILQKDGYDVTLASNGQEALDYLAENRVDLVILDIDMPEVDGITVLRDLRGREDYMDVPICMLTASGQDDDRVAAQGEGADEFLTKPVASHILLETIQRLLG